MRLGFALSGGGARGVGHLGMLQALDEAGIRPDIISGTSAGSIVATLYANGHKPGEILGYIEKTKVFSSLRPALSFTGFLKINTLGEIMKKHLTTNNFKDLQVPVIIVATDIASGKSVYFEEGELITPIMASCCIPVFFSPVNMEGRVMVDGGVLDNLPVTVLKERCDFVIGFHTNSISPLFEVSNIKSVIERSLIMAINGNTIKSKELCNFVIEPPELGEFNGFDLGKSREMFNVGYEYARAKIEDLQEALSSHEVADK